MILLLAVSSTMLTGCAGACQRIKSNGSVIGSTNGNWLVIKQSGGHITDVYILENVMVQSEGGSDGWLFLDQLGNPTHIGGDMKAIRITSDKQYMFNSCIEYHQESDTLTYFERLKHVMKQRQTQGLTTRNEGIN